MLLPNLICKLEKEKKNIAQRKKEAEQTEEEKGEGEGETEHYKSFNHNAMKYVYRK